MSYRLCSAAWKGQLQLVRCLVEEEGLDPGKCVELIGRSPLHSSSRGGHLQVVKYLIEEKNCEPNCQDREGITSLHLACGWGHLEIVKYLIQAVHCDANAVDKYGSTPLHYASRWGHVEVVKYLLVKCKINPNCVDNDGQTPLDLAVHHSMVAIELVKAGAKAATKPLEPPVKIFIVGNPSVGKSSLTAALQYDISGLKTAMASITGPHLVPDVEQKTAGIVPYQFTSRRYGSVTFYDCAGQQEYYASHAALLQNSCASSSPLFIIVVNLCESKKDIREKIVYWISFLANHFTSSATKPHVIIIGSHSDVVKSKGDNPKAKVNMDFLQAFPVASDFNISNFITMDCRQSNSRDIVSLAESIKRSCETLRKQVDTSYSLHHLLTYLLDTFRATVAISLHQVLSSASVSSDVPTAARNTENLQSSCSKLHEAGHIIYIKDPDMTKSWIILDQATIISEVSRVIFSPENLHSNATGVVPASRLAKLFPQYNPEMLVQLLSYLEFCHEIQSLKVQAPCKLTPNERYLFFPALVSTTAPTCIWESTSQFPLVCGWMLQCSEAEHFFTSQFLQVLLLRIAFSFALAVDSVSNLVGSGDILVLQRKCSIWKNGIFWGSRRGVEALVEIRYPPQNKEVVVMLRCWSGKEVECANLRSNIIQMVLRAKEEVCPRVLTKEFLLHPSQARDYKLKSPTVDNLISIREVSMAIIEGAPGVVALNGTSVDMKCLLFFEPYADIDADILKLLFSGEAKVVSDKFLYGVADRIYHKKDLFALMLKVSHSQVTERIRQAPPGRCEEFVCVLQCWRGDSGTFQSLRETLDQFSVFAGRNPLVSMLDLWFLN